MFKSVYTKVAVILMCWMLILPLSSYAATSNNVTVTDIAAGNGYSLILSSLGKVEVFGNCSGNINHIANVSNIESIYAGLDFALGELSDSGLVVVGDNSKGEIGFTQDPTYYENCSNTLFNHVNYMGGHSNGAGIVSSSISPFQSGVEVPYDIKVNYDTSSLVPCGNFGKIILIDSTGQVFYPYCSINSNNNGIDIKLGDNMINDVISEIYYLVIPSSAVGEIEYLNGKPVIVPYTNNYVIQFTNKSRNGQSIQAYSPIIQVVTSPSSDTIFVVRKDGLVVGWGDNEYKLLTHNYINGNPVKYFSTPVIINSAKNAYLQNVSQIAEGKDFVVVLKTDERVYSWGNNEYGQLGISNTDTKYEEYAVPVINMADQTGYLTNIRSITCGKYFAAALNKDQLGGYSWGNNYEGQCAVGLPDPIVSSATPLDLPFNYILSINAGGSDLEVRRANDDSIWFVGQNDEGQFGDLSTSASYDINAVVEEFPHDAVGLYGTGKISISEDHVLAIDWNGVAWAWGDNNFGQLGFDTGSQGYSAVASPMCVNYSN